MRFTQMSVNNRRHDLNGQFPRLERFRLVVLLPTHEVHQRLSVARHPLEYRASNHGGDVVADGHLEVVLDINVGLRA